jgi:hypothetical protein
MRAAAAQTRGRVDAPISFEAYWAAIEPAVAPFEARRRKVRRRLLSAWVAWSIPVGALLGPLVAFGGGDWSWALWIMCSALGYAVIWQWGTADYRRDFKRDIIDPAVRGYSPSLRYQPDGGLKVGEVAASGLFPKPVPSIVSCEDLIGGQLGATDIRFCEVRVIGMVERAGGRRRQQQLFAGLFLIADFHKHHRGAVHVLPRDSNPLRSVFDRIRGRSREFWGDEVLMEDPEFNRLFVVRSKDQVEARYVLSVSLIERIRDFRERTGQPLMLGFVDGTLHLAVWTGRNLFEPRVFRTVDDREIYRRFWEDMQLFGGVVEAFALNTRIWTKA